MVSLIVLYHASFVSYDVTWRIWGNTLASKKRVYCIDHCQIPAHSELALSALSQLTPADVLHKRCRRVAVQIAALADEPVSCACQIIEAEESYA